MKRVFFLIVILQLVLVVKSADVTIGDIRYYVYPDLSSATVSSIPDYATITEIQVPDSIFYNLTYIPVTRLGYASFKDCRNLQSVKIGNCVKAIGNQCFNNCSKLREIVIPKSVSSIVIEDSPMFLGCDSLSSIIVSSENPYFDSRENCNAIIETSTNTLVAACSSTVIPSTIDSIGDYVFQNMVIKGDLVLGGNIKSLGKKSFLSATLESVTICSPIKSIPAYCFESSKIQSLNILDSVETIDLGAFSNAVIATELTLPESLKEIKNSAFASINVPAITLGNSLKTIGIYAFAGCKFKSIVIPNSVETLGGYAFYGSSLEHITLGNSIETIGYMLLSGSKSLKSITIPSNVNLLMDYSLSICSKLDTVIIKGPVKMGKGIFDGTPLKYIYLGGNVTLHSTANGRQAFPESIKTYELDARVTDLTDIYLTSNNNTKYYCRGLIPPTADDYTFKDGLYQSEIHVPASAVNTYKNTLYWCNFYNIIGDITFFGDINGDALIDISDVNIAINAMLGKIDEVQADINGDGVVDIADVNLVINAMLGK